MALSPQIMQAYQEYDPNGTPEDAQRMFDYLKNANPDMQVDDASIIDAFSELKGGPNTMGSQAAPLPQAPAEMPAPEMMPPVQQAPAPIDTYQQKYTAERLAELQAAAKAKREGSSGWEALGGVIAGFGGPQVSQQYANNIEAKRASENKDIKDFILMQNAEQADISMKKTARMEQAAAEQARQLTDPNSSASKAAFNGLKVMASNNPRLMSIIDQMRPEDMTAANLTQLIPSLKVAVEYDFKQQKLTNDREVADAKQEAANAKAAASRENQIGRLNLAAEKARSAQAGQEGGSYDKFGRYTSKQGEVFTAGEMEKKRREAQDMQAVLKKANNLTDDNIDKSISSLGINYAMKGDAAKMVGNVGTDTAAEQAKFMDIVVPIMQAGLPPGAASDKDVLLAQSGFPGFSDKKALKEWKDRVVGEAKDRALNLSRTYDLSINIPEDEAKPAKETKTVGGKTYVKVNGGWEMQ